MESSKKKLNLLGVLIFLFLGMLNAGTQAVVNNLARAWGATESQMGLMISTFYGGSVFVAVFLGELSERVGKRYGLCAATVSLMAGSLLILMSPHFYMLLAGLLLCGFAFGGMESLTLSLLEDVNDSKARKVFGVTEITLGLGGVLAPILISWGLKSDAYKPMYLILLMVGAALTFSFLRLSSIDSFAKRQEKRPSLSILQTLKNKALRRSMIAVFLFLGVESTVTCWTVTLMANQGFEEIGNIGISAYWLAFMICPYLSTKVKNYFRWFPFCFALGGLGLLALVFAPWGWAKLLAMIFTGIMISPAFANLMFIGGHSVRENSAAGYSMMVFGGNLGSILFQPGAARIVEFFSVEALYLALAMGCLVNGIVIFSCVRAYQAEKLPV